MDGGHGWQRTSGFNIISPHSSLRELATVYDHVSDSDHVFCSRFIIHPFKSRQRVSITSWYISTDAYLYQKTTDFYFLLNYNNYTAHMSENLNVLNVSQE